MKEIARMAVTILKNSGDFVMTEQQVVDKSEDSTLDAWAGVVLVMVIVATAVFWVSGQ